MSSPRVCVCVYSCAQAAYKTGDRAKAAVLQKQLMTDEEKMAKGIMKWKPKI